MDWREFLEKDSLDGKQGHDPKKFEWNSHYTDNKEEITDMKPEDFQDLTVGQAGSDAHARHPKNMFPEKKNPKTGKYEKQKPKRDSFIDDKDDDDKRYPIDPKRSKDERDELFRERENRRQSSHRGDELGAVEGYKRQLRHGGKPEIPALGTRTDSQGRKHVTDHEGRHRAQAALEEGEKTIPVAVNHNRGSMALGREKRLNQKEIDEMGGEQGEPTSPRHNRDRISSGINSMHYHNQPKDKKIQQGMEALKSWESWLEKDALDGKGANDKIKDPEWVDDPPVDDAYGKDVKIKPKKFLNVAHDAKLYRTDSKGDETESSKKITRKQTNSGKLTGLDDAHSNEVFGGRPNPRGDGGHRGDELGAVEHYKRKLRHGKMVGKPNFSLSSGKYDEDNKISGHEGRHRARAAMEEGHKEIPTKLVAYSGASADEYGVGLKNRGRKGMKGLKYEDKKPKTDRSEDTRHPIFGRKKSWESWLEKGKFDADKIHPTNQRNLDFLKERGIKGRISDKPCPNCHKQGGLVEAQDKKTGKWSGMGLNASQHITHKKLDKPKETGKFIQTHENTHGEEICPDCDNNQTYKELKEDRGVDEANSIASYTGSKPKNIKIDKSWELWLEKNNAIETSHKEDEKKHEWDGKFSSSTIRDDVKDDDKAVSEEESLEELTDGKLEEVEKLKSDVDKIITDLARKIKNPKRREDIVQRQAEQKVKETVTKAWELFLVNKIPMNQYDKQPQKKPNEKGLKPEPLTETVPISNPKGSIGKKKVKRLDHEAGDGSRKIVEIPKELSTNPETDIGGGRPEEPNVVGDLKQGSVNATAGGTGKITQENTNSILYNALAEEEKEKEADNKTDDEVTISNDETDHATGVTEETPAQKRARIIRQFDRKKRDKKGKIIKSWETWLEKKSRFKPSNPLHRNIHPHNIPIKDDPYYKNVDLSVDYSQTADARAGDDEYDAIRREKIRRETRKKSWETWLEKGRWDNPKHDTNTQKEYEAFEKLSKLPKNEVTELGDAIDEAIEGVKSGKLKKSWESWLEKENKPKKYSGLTPKQRKLQESIDSENDSDNQYYTKSWEGWLEKMQGAGDARFGNQHLTGLDQKPVDNEEDEANILPEKEQKTDNKEEKQEETDNKPYKALGGE